MPAVFSKDLRTSHPDIFTGCGTLLPDTCATGEMRFRSAAALNDLIKSGIIGRKHFNGFQCILSAAAVSKKALYTDCKLNLQINWDIPTAISYCQGNR